MDNNEVGRQANSPTFCFVAGYLIVPRLSAQHRLGYSTILGIGFGKLPKTHW